MTVIICYVQPPCDSTAYLPCLIRITSLLTRYRRRTALWKKPRTTPKERTSLDSSKLAVVVFVCLFVFVLVTAVTISFMLYWESAIHFHSKTFLFRLSLQDKCWSRIPFPSKRRGMYPVHGLVQHHMKMLLNSFHLNGDTPGFYPQT